MTVTSAQVAKAAGVSRATVSYVLNDAPGRVLSPDTRETVLRVARELGYQPNALARSLKRGRSNTVLFPTPHVPPNHIIRTMMDAFTTALAPRGLTVMHDPSVHVDPAAQVEAWAQLAPAAVLDLTLRHDHPALALLAARGIPVLSAALPDENAWESSGDVFAREQKLATIRYLVDRGHRRIRCLLPTELPVDPRTEKLLLSDARKLVAAAGGRFEVERLHLQDVASAIAGWDSLPEAVAAHNDSWAIAVITALQSRGARVPDDVAVIGADDEPLGAVITPAVTTVAGDFSQFAVAVADAVEAVLAGRPATALPVPGRRLVVRDSA
ncbi:MAG: putative LacI-family transcriptional regulator [Frankiales bacterium]|nr:putative LacI-family transcriptional regulator [Frankiales bacterium]